MDESTHGVVYFTLGTNVVIESFPPTRQQDFYASFKKISPTRVLIKVANSTKLAPGLPENVKTMPWIPQQRILGKVTFWFPCGRSNLTSKLFTDHPNTKVFISHCGLGGTLEALYFGIPVIGIPLYGDQLINVDSLVDKGISVRLDFDRISEQTLDAALNETLSNPKYKYDFFELLIKGNQPL